MMKLLPVERSLARSGGWRLDSLTYGFYPALWLGAALLALGACSVPGEPTSDPSWSQRLEASWLVEAQIQSQSRQTAALNTQEDAAGGCDGVKNGKWGFHTGLTQEPWWHVDLGQSQPIARIVIWNRCETAERAAHIRVLLSDNGKQWQRVYEHNGATFFGFTDNQPLEVKLANLSARFVRLQLPDRQYLHLEEVEVFGADQPAKNLALHRPADQISLSTWSASHAQPLPPNWPALTRQALAHCGRLIGELAKSGFNVTEQRAHLQRLETDFASLKQDRASEKSSPSESQASAPYLAARRLQRQLLLANPLLDFEGLLFTKRVPGSFNHMSDQYYGWWSKPGGGIYILRNFKGDQPVTECLTESFKEPGTFIRPTLSYDAKKVLFAYCRYYPHVAGEKDKLNKANVPEDAFFHLYEMNLDGTGVRRLTHGKYDDFDGRYLPDGRIVFLSTRRGQSLQVGRSTAHQTLVQPDLPDIYVRCGGDASRPVAVYTLHTMNADGGDLCAISPFEMFEWTPEVANDGSILYSRWDYIDRHNMPYMSLWAINPDGVNARLVYGNYTKAPHCTFEPRCVPNSHKIVFTASAHHAQTMGSLVLLDPHAGTEGEVPVTRLTPEVAFPEIEGWPITSYASPWPLSERFHLVSWGHEGVTVPGKEGWDRWHSVQRPANGMALYFLDAAGAKELIYSDPAISCGEPIPIQPRAKPPVLSSPVNWAGAPEGAFLVANVYQGLKTVQPGDIKALRIVAVPGKTHPVMNFPNMGITADDPGKCVLGTVPVEKDGSAYFRVPAGVIMFFQALDAQGLAVQTMRSATHVQPGQTLGCVGCHENRHTTPPPSILPLAAAREPSKITPGPDGSWPVRYDQLVQPVLNQHCVSCHQAQGSDPKAARMDLASAKSYDVLIRYGKPSLFDQVSAAYHQGYSVEGDGIAHRSALLAYLRASPSHAQVMLDEESRLRLVTWMDTYAQRLGAFSEAQEQSLRQLRFNTANVLRENQSILP